MENVLGQLFPFYMRHEVYDVNKGLKLVVFIYLCQRSMAFTRLLSTDHLKIWILLIPQSWISQLLFNRISSWASWRGNLWRLECDLFLHSSIRPGGWARPDSISPYIFRRHDYCRIQWIFHDRFRQRVCWEETSNR